MNIPPPEFDRLLAESLSEVGNFQVLGAHRNGAEYDFRVQRPDGAELLVNVKEFKRFTPAIAESACLMLKRRSETTGAQPIIFAALVSDRTSEIATRHGVSWMDYVGNCRLVFPQHGIYVRRSGIDNPFGKQLPKVLNVFSTKSSRVVRAMLQEPMRSWQLNELAGHPDVRVSPGLMSRIKRSLIEGGYALMRDGQLHLKRIDLAFESFEPITIEGRMPDGSVNKVTARLVAPEAYILIKAIALEERTKDKDAYDIAFVLNHYQPSLADLAKKVHAISKAGIGKEALELLRTKFRTFDSVGPVWAARAATTAGEDHDLFQRAAYEDATDLFRSLDAF